jgi:glutamate racemase
MISDASFPIGIFDSGVGGLSILQQIRSLLPNEQLIYVADQFHVPYGPRSVYEVQQFSVSISRFLLTQHVKLVVVACNTASAAALSLLRQQMPQLPFVGMEPAVKPAAQRTKTGKVGVLATEGTFASERYADLMARFAQEVDVFEDPCLGLVDLIEQGQFNETETLLWKIISPMLASDVDTLVLGCTHYPFVIPVLEKMVGTAVSIIDPSAAVARQVKRVLAQSNLLAANSNDASLNLITTGAAEPFRQQVQQLLGYEQEIKTAVWHKHDSQLILQNSQLLL